MIDGWKLFYFVVELLTFAQASLSSPHLQNCVNEWIKRVRRLKPKLKGKCPCFNKYLLQFEKYAIIGLC